MSQTESRGTFRELCDAYARGDMSRRQFIAYAGAFGIAASTATWFLNASDAIAAGNGNSANMYPAAQATPETGIPAVGMDGVTRGQGGTLNIIQHQAATILFSHKATGTKDFLISDMILEPLFRYLPDGSLTPCLAAAVPSVDAGTLDAGLTWATVSVKEGVLWSDGTPLTSKDLRFTWEWNTTASNASVNIDLYETIADVEIIDDLTATYHFASPSAAWADPLTGGTIGHIIPSHAFGDDPANANDAFLIAPLGTGAFVVESFEPNNNCVLVANENYRDPNKPFFSNILITGGGQADSAARAVLQTGEYDYAWNLQVEPAVLESMISDDSPGDLEINLGTSLERIHINFSDPNTEVNGQRSEVNTPHPFLTDPAVRQALNKAVNRQLIADDLYGNGQQPTGNLLNGLEAFTSPNTSWEFNLEAAAAILDEAGWALDGDVRKKDGVELNIVYATSINPTRQKNQQIIKDDWESIGIKVELEQVDAGIYFGGDPDNDQNINHFYWDIDMYTNNPTSPVPITFLLGWYAGPDNSNVAQASNDWSGQNYSRWVNPDFDAKFDALKAATTLDEAFALSIELNDIAINAVAAIPEVNRAADVYAISKKLVKDNIALGVGLELNYWNIANWCTTDGAPIR